MNPTRWMPMAALALLTFAPLAQAQDAPPPRAERAALHKEHRLDVLAVTLDLTDAQKTQIASILDAKEQERNARREARTADRPERRERLTAEQRAERMKARAAQMDARRAEMQAERAETTAAIRAVLNPQQAEKFDQLEKLQQEHRAGLREHRQEQRGDRRENRRGRRRGNG